MNNGNQGTRCGSCAIIGQTNAGKSTLMNLIVGNKVSIVSRKQQTTRCRINGIYTEGDSQIIFVDTPGLFQPRRILDRAMIDEVWRTIVDVDSILILVDACSAQNENPDFTVLNSILEHRHGNQPVFLALNKCDSVHPKEKLMDLAAAYNARYAFEKTFMISGKTGDGVHDLIQAISLYLPIGPFLYPADMVTDASMKLVASEVTREQIFHRLHQELPYSMMVETTGLIDEENGDLTIHQNIIVGRENHKGIVIGKKGATLKQIGASARHEMYELFERNIHLFIHVIVDEKWDQKKERLRLCGLLLG